MDPATPHCSGQTVLWQFVMQDSVSMCHCFCPPAGRHLLSASSWLEHQAIWRRRRFFLPSSPCTTRDCCQRCAVTASRNVPLSCVPSLLTWGVTWSLPAPLIPVSLPAEHTCESRSSRSLATQGASSAMLTSGTLSLQPSPAASMPSENAFARGYGIRLWDSCVRQLRLTLHQNAGPARC